MLAKIPQFRGLTPWILVDFRSPMRQLPGVQDGYNRKGLISDRGEKKESFYLLQKPIKTGLLRVPDSVLLALKPTEPSHSEPELETDFVQRTAGKLAVLRFPTRERVRSVATFPPTPGV
jgi:hypothetical protein